MAVSGAVHLADVDERQHRRQARLRSHPLLAGCSTHVLRRFAAASDEIVIAAGQVMVAQGHHGLWFFVIDRKSTRLNSSHSQTSYAGSCLKKQKEPEAGTNRKRTRLKSSNSQSSYAVCCYKNKTK